MSSPIRPKHFKEQVYFSQLRSRVDGNAKVEHGLTQIVGIGRRFAQAIIIVANISPELRIGAVSEKDLNRIEEIVLNPLENGIPSYLLNRKKDLRTGDDRHLLGNQLEITVKRDIDRMKRNRSYKGIRHHLHLKVRGQRTKSTGRHGLVVGVMRRRIRQQQNKGD